jgi:hypothetical protein
VSHHGCEPQRPAADAGGTAKTAARAKLSAIVATAGAIRRRRLRVPPRRLTEPRLSVEFAAVQGEPGRIGDAAP